LLFCYLVDFSVKIDKFDVFSKTLLGKRKETFRKLKILDRLVDLTILQQGIRWSREIVQWFLSQLLNV